MVTNIKVESYALFFSLEILVYMGVANVIILGYYVLVISQAPKKSLSMDLREDGISN